MKVLLLPETIDYFLELAQILYEEDYFGFEDSAIKYVEDLFYDIQNTLPNRLKKQAPELFCKRFKEESLLYAIFKKNNHTKWYVFFTIYKDGSGETIYLVQNISNNHMVAQYL